MTQAVASAPALSTLWSRLLMTGSAEWHWAPGTIKLQALAHDSWSRCTGSTTQGWNTARLHSMYIMLPLFVVGLHHSDIISVISWRWYMRCMRWGGESPSLHFYRLSGFLTSHIIFALYERNWLTFDDAVSYIQCRNGTAKCYDIDRICTHATKVTNPVP